ncbi:MAG: hypothetical protein CMB82_11685 [Flammeovirgaceae bacterium]|nr:hypothetical protein [Flammeovirgaceae bacterium]
MKRSGLSVHYRSKDLFEIMRLTFFISCLTISGLFAADVGYAQSKKITIDFENVELETIIKEIKNQSEFNFFYQADLLEDLPKIDLSVNKVPIKEVLEDITPDHLTYEVVDKTIIIKEKAISKEINIKQERNISGTVVDANNETVPGVTVQVSGTTTGTITDMNGKYELSIPEQGSELIFSSIGYESQTVNIGARSIIDIVLIENIAELEEIIVTGYGTQKKVNLTGSVTTVGSKEIEARPITSAATALQGTTTGVFINQNSGQAGRDNVTIRIRGISTLNNSNPLVLVDGVEAPLNNINPTDIESMTVLKDAASSAIYGSRAANGVVLITTKRGSKDQKPTFSYDSYIASTSATFLPSMVNDARTYADLRNEAETNFGRDPKYDAANLALWDQYGDEMSTDWGAELFRTAPMQQHNLGVTGGGNNTNYRISIGLLDQEGIHVNSDFKRINSRINLDTKVNDKFSFGTSLSLARGDRNGPGDELDGGGIAIGLPNKPATKVIGGVERFTVQNPEISQNDGFGNPYANAFRQNTNVVNNDILANAYLAFEPIEGLTFKLTTAANYQGQNFSNFQKSIDQYDFRTGELITAGFNYYGVRQKNENRSESLQTTLWLTATYEKTFGDHEIKVLAGLNEEEAKYSQLGAFRTGYLSNSVQVLNAGLSEGQTNFGSATEWGLRSYFGRANYNFQGKYLLEANVRYDGSSRFANDKWGFFPAFSAGWILSQETFLQNVGGLDFLKIRASWGQLGNNATQTRSGGLNNFLYSRQLNLAQNYSFGGTIAPGVTQTSLGNADLSWETSTMTNIGINATFLNNLDVEFDYFVKETDNILFDIPVSALSGFNSLISNAAIMEAKGWELALSYNGTIGDLTYSIGGNVTNVTNKIIELNPNLPTGEVDRIIIGGGVGSNMILEEGTPINSYYGLEHIGVFQNAAELAEVDHSGLSSDVGDLRFKDQNGDGVINADDRVVTGKQDPSFLYGGNINLGYKGFDLAVIVQGQADFEGYTTLEFGDPFFNGANVTSRWLGRWTPENPSTTIPRIFNSNGPSNFYHNDWYIFDRSYFRIKNVQIGYNIPNSIASKAGLSNARVFLNGTNLFTKTDDPYGDPERLAAKDRGLSFPMLKVYSAGVSLKF